MSRRPCVHSSKFCIRARLRAAVIVTAVVAGFGAQAGPAPAMTSGSASGACPATWAPAFDDSLNLLEKSLDLDPLPGTTSRRDRIKRLFNEVVVNGAPGQISADQRVAAMVEVRLETALMACPNSELDPEQAATHAATLSVLTVRLD